MATVKTAITKLTDVDGYSDIDIEVFKNEQTVELSQDTDTIAFNISDLDDLRPCASFKESVK